MDKETFSNRLQEVTRINRDFATRFVSNHLPDSNRYLVRLNQSCDDNLKTGEHVFPRDTDPVFPLSAAEAVDLLCRENRVPEWIDISVERADSEHTYLLLLCCGRFTDDETALLPRHWSCTVRLQESFASSALVRGPGQIRPSLQTRMSRNPTSPNKIAPPEPPPPVSGSIGPVHRTLDSLAAVGTLGRSVQ